MGRIFDAAAVDEIPVGSHKVVTVKGRTIGIFNIDGTFHALPNICPHQIGPLCEGKVSGTLYRDKKTWELHWTEEGQIVTCPWHGLEFRVQTGECLAYKQVKLRTYKVTPVDGRLLVEL
ncbi:Rieske 2Fe-2S domain-containing protein [Paenibacillus sp. FSL R7-0652]|uniref:Rieske (2Fe-2S) protein n=1 Tax=Paenibacillus sp. FSL R7-0652 TaxID=2921687 RepID=UPI00315A0BF6